jgi:hypothetical protein
VTAELLRETGPTHLVREGVDPATSLRG